MGRQPREGAPWSAMTISTNEADRVDVDTVVGTPCTSGGCACSRCARYGAAPQPGPSNSAPLAVAPLRSPRVMSSSSTLGPAVAATAASPSSGIASDTHPPERHQSLLSRLRSSVLPNPTTSLSSVTALAERGSPSSSTGNRRPLTYSYSPASSAALNLHQRRASEEDMRILARGRSRDHSRATTSALLSAPTTTLANIEAEPNTPPRSPTVSISRAGASRTSPYNMRSRDADALPRYDGNMLPPRLGTPIPGQQSQRRSFMARVDDAHDPASDVDASLTTLGRRTQARMQNSGSATLSRPTTDSNSAAVMRQRLEQLDSDINMVALNRAQNAIEGSRTALSQARDAIRNALVHSERLERIASILRRQASASSAAEAAAAHSDLEALESARSDLNLERSLADLRAASLEINRVIALSRSPYPWRSASEMNITSSSRIPPASTAVQALTASITPEATAESTQTTSALGGSLLEPFPGPSSTETSRIPIHSSYNSRLSSLASLPRPRPLNPLMTDLRLSSTTTLARQILANARAAVSSDAVADESANPPSLEDSIELAPAPNDTASPPRRRRRGGWTRLDANGDEIESDREFDTQAAAGVRAGHPGRVQTSLGWRWIPASLVDMDDAEEDKASIASPNSPGWSFDSHEATTRTAATVRHAIFRTDREMVGR